MRTNIKATGIELTPAIRDYIESKLSGHLERFLDPKDESAIADIEIGKTTQHHQKGDVFRAEVNLHMARAHLRAEAKSGDVYSAIDFVENEIVREITAYRDRRLTLVRRGARAFKETMRLVGSGIGYGIGGIGAAGRWGFRKIKGLRFRKK